MSSTNDKRAAHISHLVARYEAAVDILASSGDGPKELADVAFLPRAVADALGEALSTRAPFRSLATSPAFTGKGRRVAGSLWHRSLGWHSGSGNLWGLHSVVWDSGSVARRPEGRGLPGSWLAELERAGSDPRAFQDALETTATIYRLVHHGSSPAVDAWASVLGRRVTA